MYIVKNKRHICYFDYYSCLNTPKFENDYKLKKLKIKILEK